MIILEIFEILFRQGIIVDLLDFSNPQFSRFIYSLILVGFAIQYLLLWKARKPVWRWSFTVFLILVTLGCEISFHHNASDLGIVLLCGIGYFLALGALAATVVHTVKYHTRHSL